jgi:hypothetical protein
VNTFLFPVFRQSLFDPDNPVYVRFGIGGSAGLRLTRGLFVEGTVVQSLYDTFGQIKRETNSVLPHVRSDFPHYLKEGKFEIANLSTSYFLQICSRDLWTRERRLFGGNVRRRRRGIAVPAFRSAMGDRD